MVIVSITNLVFFDNTGNILFEHFPHFVNALPFLLHIGMHIEIESRADVRMTKEDTDGFIVAFALNAAGGKAVTQAVEAHFGEAELLLEFVEVAAVGSWFRRLCSIGEHIEIPTDNLLQRAHERQEVTGHGNLPDGVLSLGFVDDEFCVFLLPIHQVDALDGFAHTDHTCSHIDVIPLQGADFADSKAGV